MQHEPLKPFFKTKVAKVAQNCSSQSQLSLARQAEITFSRYELTLFEGYLREIGKEKQIEKEVDRRSLSIFENRY